MDNQALNSKQKMYEQTFEHDVFIPWGLPIFMSESWDEKF